MKLKLFFLSAFTALTLAPMTSSAIGDGSKNNPIRVLMVPADTGTNDITSDYGPVFRGITEKYGIHFDLKAGASYAAVVEGMCGDKADVAWFGAVTYGQANDKCGVELLAVDVSKGESAYFSGIFVRRDSGINSLKDLKGKSIAFGSPNSTSSFNFPVAMMINAGVDPVKDVSKIIMAGSHSASLAALSEGKVDAAAAAYNSFEKAAEVGAIDPSKFKPLAKSQPIPNPPLAMNIHLNSDMKAKLRQAFANIHKQIDPSLIRGYGGKKVDRYDTEFKEEDVLDALKKLSAVTPDLKAEMIGKAGQR